VVTEEKLFLPGAEELKEEGAAAGGAKGLKTLLLEQNVQEKEVNNYSDPHSDPLLDPDTQFDCGSVSRRSKNQLQ
jgi:hypothetical protein